MNEAPVICVAAKPEQTAAVGKFVADLFGGKIDIGDGSFIKAPPPWSFDVQDLDADGGRRIRLTLSRRMQIDGPGIDPWFEYLDLYPDGRAFARISKAGFSLDYRVR